MKNIMMILLSLIAFHASAGYVCGRYTGNGGASKSITGVGFSPSCVLVKGATTQTAWFATSTMTAGYAKLTTGTAAPATGYINSLDADGFTVGSSANSNTSGVVYYFVVWDATNVDVGSFTANDCETAWSNATWYNIGDIMSSGGHNYTSILAGSNHAAPNATYWTDNGACSAFGTAVTVGSGYRPAMLFVYGEGTQWYNLTPGQFIMDGSYSNKAWHFNSGGALAGSDVVVADLSATGFTTKAVQVGTANSTGFHNSTKYNYVAIKSTANIASTTYAGNSAPRTIVASINPTFILVKDVNGGQNPWFKSEMMGPDSSYKFTDVANTTNIKKFTSTGFTLGAGGETNGGSTFQYFAMGGGVTLPVKLTYFYGEKENSSVKLFWQTAAEINSDYFMVERSSDGINFDPIDLVESAGNSSSLVNYSYTDENPAAGKNYYRLKQIDNDGQYALFHVVMVDLTDGTSLTQVEVFPTETEDLAHIVLTAKKAEIFLLQIFDQSGKELYHSSLSVNEGANALDLPVASYETGYYNVRITSAVNPEVFQKRFLKK